VFGSKVKALDLTQANIESYKNARLGEGSARATINNELSWLRRGFILARRFGKILVVPEVTQLSGSRIREGFLEDDTFYEVHAKLPAEYKDIVHFLFLTCWRRNEARHLKWKDIDRKRKVIRIEKTKTNVPRTLPYGSLPGLIEIIDRRWRERTTSAIEPQVFGKVNKVGLWKAFRDTCQECGYPGRTIHDLRRSAARRMLRAGIPEPVIMKIGGWKSNSVFRRYAIVDENLIAEGLAKLGES
jgi:integrase